MGKMADLDIELKEKTQEENDKEFFERLDKYIEPIMNVRKKFSEQERERMRSNAEREYEQRSDRYFDND